MEFTTIIGGDVLFVTHSCIMPPVAVVPAPTTLLRRYVISSGVFLATQKSQVLTKFSFSGGGVGLFLATQNSKSQVLTKFSFLGRGD